MEQINKGLRLCKMWKANKIEDYPVKVEKVNRSDDSRKTRAITNNTLKESAKSNVTMNTYLNDAIKAWNKCPEDIKKGLSSRQLPTILTKTIYGFAHPMVLDL